MTSATAVRGTCVSCGRYVATYTLKSDNKPLARPHKCFQGPIDATDRDWKQCPGSNKPVKAAA